MGLNPNDTQCNRSTHSGSGTLWFCDRDKGHTGAHRALWKDRDEILRLGLRWSHEDYMGDAKWPEAKGAIDVTEKECPTCEGTGEQPELPGSPNVVTCSHCKGERRLDR